jgi:hypothetical protein
MGYKLACWQYGFLGSIEVHPLRQIQAMIRARSADASAIARSLAMSDIRDELVAERTLEA